MRQANKKKVFVGVSGGVDSSVSAVLLKKAGYDVTGVFIKVWQPDWISCTWKEDRLDAMRVCAKIGIPFLTLDLEKEYKKEVVDYMISEYKSGRTPNPDVMCNSYVKFGAFYDWALNNGADFVATGHYARIVNRETHNAKRKKKFLQKNPFSENTVGDHSAPGYTLQAGFDAQKDQSYFLWSLKRKQLSHVLFPVGHLRKSEVRKIAKKYSLVTADKKDSQGLCFVGKVDLRDFLGKFIPPKIGKVLDEQGKVVGRHDGAHFFTIGERRGFTILAKKSDENPYFVIDKDIKRNTLTVANRTAEGTLPAMKRLVEVRGVNWISDVCREKMNCQGRVRYRQPVAPCVIEELKGDKAKILFEKPQLATAGQALVLYRGDECVGGGIIQ